MNFAGSLNDIAANCFIIWIGDRRISRDDTPADCAGTTPAGVLYESRRTCLCPTSNQIGFDPSISEGRFQMFNAPDESVDPVPRPGIKLGKFGVPSEFSGTLPAAPGRDEPRAVPLFGSPPL